MYKVSKLIGSGAFGSIYKGSLSDDPSKLVAIKMEPMNARYPQLKLEYKCYKQLQGINGIAQCYYYGHEGGYRVLVLQYLNTSVSDLFTSNNDYFDTKMVAYIGINILKILQKIHERGVLHRDMKPENMMIDEHNNIYLIDFGLSKPYIRNGKIIPLRRGRSLCGTPRYASINAHRGLQQSRRDDLESLAYILIYFLKGGNLPWQGLSYRKKRLNQEIYKLKASMDSKVICHGLPTEFEAFLSYCRKLKYHETPNYNFLIYLLKKFNHEGCSVPNEDE